MAWLLLLAILLGFSAGLRSMLAPALTAWAAHLGWLHLGESALAFLASPISVGVFSVLAAGELIADKLPFIPNRIEPGPLVTRLLSGGLCAGALFLSSRHGIVAGAITGALGALAGAFVGYGARKRLVTKAHLKDFLVALPEDLLAIGCALFVLTR